MTQNHKKVNFHVNLLDMEMDSFLRKENLRGKEVLKVSQAQEQKVSIEVTDLSQVLLYLPVKINFHKNKKSLDRILNYKHNNQFIKPSWQIH